MRKRYRDKGAVTNLASEKHSQRAELRRAACVGCRPSPPPPIKEIPPMAKPVPPPPPPDAVLLVLPLLDGACCVLLLCVVFCKVVCGAVRYE